MVLRALGLTTVATFLSCVQDLATNSRPTDCPTFNTWVGVWRVVYTKTFDPACAAPAVHRTYVDTLRENDVLRIFPELLYCPQREISEKAFSASCFFAETQEGGHCLARVYYRLQGSVGQGSFTWIRSTERVVYIAGTCDDEAWKACLFTTETWTGSWQACWPPR